MNCLSHQNVVAVSACSDCGAGLCADCVNRSEYTVDNKALCRSCNYKLIQDLLKDDRYLKIWTTAKAVRAIHGVERYVPEQGTQLRAETPGDSAVGYNAAGDKTNKYVYLNDNSRGTYKWENNAWIYINPSPEEWIWDWIRDWQSWQSKVSYETVNEQLRFCIPHGQSSWYSYWFMPADTKFNTAYDKSGNLISFEAIDEKYGLDEKFSIKYNTFNKPVSMERYYHGTLGHKANWEYNAAGFVTLFELYNNGKTFRKEADTYDAKGNLISIEYYEGNSTNGLVLDRRSNYKWDDRNRIISDEYMNYTEDYGHRTDYEWDNKGRKKKLSEYLWSANGWVPDQYYIYYYTGDERIKR
jgi:hypothetical protein